MPACIGPPIPEPSLWAQYDFSDGPVVDGVKTTLFHYYLPYSKYRIVLYIPDQSLPNVIGALHTCFEMTGGIPRTCSPITQRLPLALT